MNNENPKLQKNDAVNTIKDLTVNKDQAADIKGGPIEIRELHIKVNVANE
jgi:hypothetical protein